MNDQKKLEAAGELLAAPMSEARVVADLVSDHIKHQVVDVEEPYSDERGKFLVLPKGLRVESIKRFIDEFRTEPERRRGTAKFDDLTSFIDHANRFKDADSTLWANCDEDAPQLVSVLDYHCNGSDGVPRFGEHRGRYPFPLSEEWSAWRDNEKRQMGQAEFAEFIENRILDITDPATAGEGGKRFVQTIGAHFGTPSKLLELSRGLSVRVGAKVQNAMNLATGEASIQFVTTHTDENGSPVRVPAAFLIVVPVFRSGVMYQVAARLRYRVRDGQISWFYELYRAEQAFDDAFREACETARKGTGLPLFMGQPE